MTTTEISDPLFSDQWHFDLLGDIETIWTEYSGAGVTVGIYDTGVDTDHEDLDDNYDASLESIFVNGEYNTTFDGHGTSVAGLIAAENNGVGGVGVAWGATLGSVDYLNDAFTFDRVEEVIDHISTFDIVNQSYGFTNDFNPVLSLSEPFTFVALDNARQFEAVTEGRGGLGTVIVKAVGNDANDPGLQSFGINGNAQGDAENNTHYIVAVGALEEDGFVASYSSFGANLLVSAGAGAVTTDLTGTEGYSNGNYADDFGGTSAATPVTAGVIALMLEANPHLTVPEIQMILAVSASMTGSEFGELGSGFEVSEWLSIGDGTWNGGGLTYNPSYGYGAVDAFAAVRMAEIWHLISDGHSLQDQTYVTVEDSSTHQINDFQTFDVTFDVTDGVVIDHVYVTLDITHSYSGDLEIQLITPDGDVIDLLIDDGRAEIDYSWTFGVAALRGVDSTGEWTIRVGDDASLDDGTLNNVELEFVGVEDTGQDVWHLTDDFLDLAEVEGGRRFIGDDDGDGGLDVINAVSVSGDVSVTLGEDQVLRVDGEYWVTQETDAILGVLTGDGDDRVIGRDEDELIASGRGDDLVIGSAGADEIFGQQGDDIILGDDHGGYGTEESAEMFRLYNAVFGRAPDLNGHQSWMIELLSGSMTLDEIAGLFVESAEFELTYGDANNEEFVTLLYENVLGRLPDVPGLNGWISNITNGMSRAEVVRRFSESQEHVNLTEPDREAFEGDADASVYAPRIYRLYEGIFGREPDAGGFAGWLENFANGVSFQEAIARFIDSQEFENQYAGTDDEGFLTNLYQNVLDRDPDDAGLAGWLNNLMTGWTRADVVERFVESTEFIINTGDALIDFMRDFGGGDVISAGAGENLVSGGAFADTFVFTVEDQGHTTILDFELWDELVFNDDFGYFTEFELLSALTQQGDDVVFEADGVSVTLVDTNLADLDGSEITIA